MFKKKNLIIIWLLLGLGSFFLILEARPTQGKQEFSAQTVINQKISFYEKTKGLDDLGFDHHQEMAEAYHEHQGLIDTFRQSFLKLSEGEKEVFILELLGTSDDEILAVDQEIEFIDDERLVWRLDSIRERMNAAFHDYIETLEYSSDQVESLVLDVTAKPEVANMYLLLSDVHINGYEETFPDNQFALTFDDGPVWRKYTRSVYQTLKKYKVPANFFLLGQNIEKTEQEMTPVDPVARLMSTDSTLGNHSWSHPFFESTPVNKIRKEIRKTKRILQRVTNRHHNGLFRYPFGEMAKTHILIEQDLVSVGWSIDSLDWKIKDPTRLYKRLKRSIRERGKGIILLHDTYDQASQALPKVVEYLLKRKATFLRLVREENKFKEWR